MNKKLIRRALALAGAASLCLACAAPVFAAVGDMPQEVRLFVGKEVAGQTSISGAAVAEGGTVSLKPDGKYSFQIESEKQMEEEDMSLPLVLSMKYYNKDNVVYTERFPGYVVLNSDGQMITIAKLLDGTKITTTAVFRDVSISKEMSSWNPKAVFPCLEGRAEWETRCTIGAVSSFPLSLLPDDCFSGRDECLAFVQTIKTSLNKPEAQLSEPRQITLRALEENFGGFDSVVGGSTEPDGSAGIGYLCQIQTGQWENGETINLTDNQRPCIGTTGMVLLRACGWEWENTGITRTVATTAGAAALGLGGGAVLNGMSTALENTPFARRREDFEDPDVPDDTPDLPEEDTPSVSVSFYRPFDDLVNTKGAAVDIQLTVNGGEGLHWNYLPTAICPEGLKAVIPAVVGSSNTATLVLNLTGAAMKRPHIPVFITVVAWAAGADGRLLKTTGTMELQLHRPGLEAERTADGGLKVTLYADGNLDGVAEKVVLKPQQYTCTEEADGALTIEAKPPYKGSCRIAGCKQED